MSESSKLTVGTTVSKYILIFIFLKVVLNCPFKWKWGLLEVGFLRLVPIPGWNLCANFVVPQKLQ